MPLKIISLNIETDRHLDRIIPFFNEQQADVILLQEVLEKDKAYIEKNTHMHGIFTAQNLLYSETFESPIGLLTLSRLPVTHHSYFFYRGNNIDLKRIQHGEAEKMARVLTITEVHKDEKLYRLLNTHFTWTPNAQPNDAQRDDLSILLAKLATFPEFVLCGDFNAPRGGEIFDAISAQYRDNIPLNISTTIDQQLHRHKGLKLVVDGLFTSNAYTVSDIQIMDQVSDHCAIVASEVK